MLYCRELGQGEPVVVIHGLFGMSDNMLSLGKSLSTRYHVILVDLAYHGRSPHAGGLSHSSQARAIFNTLDNLGIAQFRVIGHSLGGKVAMQMALLEPQRITALVVGDIAPILYRDDRHGSIFAAFKSVPLAQIARRSDADEFMSQFVDEAAVRQFLLKNLYRNSDGEFCWRADIQALEQAYAKIISGPDIQAQYQGPVLFIKGQHSDYITAAAQPAIEAFFPAFEFKIMSGVGHWLHAEKPALFHALVARFFAS